MSSFSDVKLGGSIFENKNMRTGYGQAKCQSTTGRGLDLKYYMVDIAHAAAYRSVYLLLHWFHLFLIYLFFKKGIAVEASI